MVAFRPIHLTLIPTLLLASTPPVEAGRSTTSVRLPVSGIFDCGEATGVQLDGIVHVVSQAFETSDGWMAGLRINIADLSGDDDSGGAWVAVGALQVPPEPVHPEGEPLDVKMPFTPIALANAVPPNPCTPEITLSLMFDSGGNLIGDLSRAEILSGPIDR